LLIEVSSVLVGRYLDPMIPVGNSTTGSRERASHSEISMATFPSSQQKKPTAYSQAELQSTISRMKVSLQIIEQKSLSLNGKINHLKKSSSNDPVQQLQTDTIVDIYQIVREMQVFLNPLLNLYPSNPFE
jgi:hypothetical protein